MKWDSDSGMGVTPVSTGQKKTVLLPYITRCDNTREAEKCTDQVVALNEGKKSKAKGLSQLRGTAVCTRTGSAFIHIEHSFQVLWFQNDFWTKAEPQK